MTAEGHLLFSIACAVFAKNAELTPVLAQGDWWHIVPSAILTCLLPDIDHPKSFLGQRLKWISKPIARAFWASWFLPTVCWRYLRCWQPFYLKVPESWFIPADALQGMVLGYLSHILADMLTPAGVPPALAMPLAFPLAYPWFPKRATNWNVLSAWHYLSGRYGCPIHYPKTALFVGHRK